MNPFGEVIDELTDAMLACRDAAIRKARIEHRADEAWRALAREENAMPAPIALDYVQDEAGDRGYALRFLIAAGVRSLSATRPREWCDDMKETGDDMLGLFEAYRWHLADYSCYCLEARVRRDLMNTETGPLAELPDDYADRYKAWLSSVLQAIALCNELCATANPQEKP